MSIRSSRLMSSTVLLLAITILSKAIAFVRELILLENVGVGSQLDAFLVIFGLVTIMTGALGICIVTSLTSMAQLHKGRDALARLMREGFAVGGLVGIAALGVALAYAWIVGENDASVWRLALILPWIAPFAVVAEYQVAIFLSRGRRTPVITGNIIISLPLIFVLLIYDLSVFEYSFGLVVGFILRALIFTFLIIKNETSEVFSPIKTHLFSQRLWPTLAGGSSMLAVGIIYVTAQMFARQLGDGLATIVGYGLKVPLFMLTTVWFVLGTKYFAGLMTHGTNDATRRIERFSAINLALFLMALVGVISLNYSTFDAGNSFLANSEITFVLAQSLPYLPIIVFVPIIEMVQRLAATTHNHTYVFYIACSILFSGLLCQIIAIQTQIMIWIKISPAIATGAGFLTALVVLAKIREPIVETCQAK